ncbi:MAG: hypothetical protein ABII22_03575 [Candidatus Micrarchaeota archaeon]
MIPNLYNGNYKLLIIPPLILIAVALFYIPQIKMGVEFTGGTLISLSLNQNVGADQLQANLDAEGMQAEVRTFDTAVGPMAEIELPQSDQLTQADKTKEEFLASMIQVQASEINSNQNDSAMVEYIQNRKQVNELANTMFGLARFQKNASSYENTNQLQKRFGDAYAAVYSNYQDTISSTISKYASYNAISVKTVSSTLSANFLEKAIQVVISAGVLSLIFVFIFIRQPIPSIAVLTGALADITIAAGAMGFFGIPLTIPSLAAILMLIGFSLDTDILLTMRMLKRGGNPRQNAFESMKTGMTMSICSIIAFGALFILAMMTNIATYYQISAVALAGLVGDLFATWGINAVMLLWYVEHKKEKENKEGTQ